jgi:alkylation response protein AidB-like acyl-CoA dehydrogenase
LSRQVAVAIPVGWRKMVLFRAGAAKHALIAAGNQMLVVPITASVRVTDRGVELAGMRTATTGSVDLTGVKVKEDWLIGAPGDYLREPTFSTGAWRSSAVALGGLAALIETAKDELRSRAARTIHSSGCVSGRPSLPPRRDGSGCWRGTGVSTQQTKKKRWLT